MRPTTLFPIGAILTVVGFVLLGVEALRVAVGDVSLTGWQSVLPWVGLGVVGLGAVALLVAVLGDRDGDTVRSEAPTESRSV